MNFDGPAKFDYEGYYTRELAKKQEDKSYRYFNSINRVIPSCLHAKYSLLKSSRMHIQSRRTKESVSGARTIILACHDTQSSWRPFIAPSTATAVAQAALATHFPYLHILIIDWRPQHHCRSPRSVPCRSPQERSGTCFLLLLRCQRCYFVYSRQTSSQLHLPFR